MRQEIIININKATLLKALNNMFDSIVSDATHQVESLHGGTVGNVCKISGEAVFAGDLRCFYTLVLKEQKKWERHGDPDSWRREYGIYQKIGDLYEVLPDNIRLPKCYLMEELIIDETPAWQMWMEYIGGISGKNLTIDMIEYVMTELGKFQGYVCKCKPHILNNISCFSADSSYYNKDKFIFMFNEVAETITPSDCDMIPEHLRDMLTNTDNIENTMSRISSFPVTLCHRDMWHTNVFLSGNIITLIDWDCTGWGFVGEDVIQMIGELFDDRVFDVAYFGDYSRRLLSAYLRGASDYIDAGFLTYEIVRDIYTLWGNGLFWRYKYSDSESEKKRYIDILQKMYEIA
ncbi:MAG: aminoglycoside phosphotransferase family protein [Oscillospiraceae bacterium]|nr:aminoglycoside phosphotransferase family protein [Oscillospiraceae bacterium]